MWPVEGASLSSPEGGLGGGRRVRRPSPQSAVMMKSLVQPEEGQSGGGRAGTPLKGTASAHGHEERAAVVRPTGTGGSDPRLGRREGRHRGQCPAVCRAPCPRAVLLGKSAGPLGPESRRHLRQRVVHGGPGQPAAGRRQSRQQERSRVELRSRGGPGAQVGQKVPAGPGPLQSARAWLPGQPDPGKAGPAAGQHEGPVRRCPWRS